MFCRGAASRGSPSRRAIGSGHETAARRGETVLEASSESPTAAALEQDWRDAVIEIARAREAISAQSADAELDEATSNRLWLRLWRAERRRDELLQRFE